NLYPFDLPEEKSHQIEHVNRCFIQKASSEAGVPNPGRIDQFAAVHFGVDGKRAKLIALNRLLQNLVNRGKTAVVTHLIDHAGAHGAVAQPGGGVKIQCEGFFTKNMLAGFENLHSYLLMRGVRSANEHGIAFLKKLLD